MSLTHQKWGKEAWASYINGTPLDADCWLDSRVRDSRLKDQTREIASRLSMFDPSIYRPKEKWVSMVSGSGDANLIESSRYQNRNILPTTMQSNSRNILKLLTRYIEEKPFTRMLVVTEGDRRACGLDELPETLSFHNDRVKDDLGPVFKEYNCEEILRRVEFTMKRDEQACVRFHVHTHILYSPNKRMPKGQWEAFLKAVRAAFGGRHVHDAGKLRDPREAVKYCCKIESAPSADKLGLLDLDPFELFQLSKSLIRRKMIRPVGKFSEFVRRLDDDCVKLKRIQIAEDQYKWIEVEKDKKRNIDCEHSGKAYRGNIILGYAMGAFTSPKIEKHLLVMDYSGNFEELKSLRSIGAEAFGFPNAIKVHTTTPTAPDPISFSSMESKSGIPPGGFDPPETSILFQNAVDLTAKESVK